MTSSPVPGPAPSTVVVLGSLNMDLVVHGSRLPRPGETLIGHHFGTDHGGKGANQAVAARRMGAAVAMVGCLGHDDHGHRLREALRREGIDTRAVREAEAGTPSGVASILVGDDGENSIVVVPGANHALRPEHLPAALGTLHGVRVLVMQLEVPLDTVHEALRLSRAAGVTTVLNAAPAATLPGGALALVDWLVVNEGEAAGLLGRPVDTPEQAHGAADALRGLGPAHVVITLGRQGLVHTADGGTAHQPAFPTEPVDSTGAGDTFVGTFAAGLAQGLAPAAALRWGQAAAALAVSRRGSQSAMPQKAEVLARFGDLTQEPA
jgi:ribokinase